jgi:hypothetical protein
VIVYGCPVRIVVVALGRYMSSRESRLIKVARNDFDLGLSTQFK